MYGSVDEYDVTDELLESLEESIVMVNLPVRFSGCPTGLEREAKADGLAPVA